MRLRPVQGVGNFGNISGCRYESECGSYLEEKWAPKNPLWTLRYLLALSEKKLGVNFASPTEELNDITHFLTCSIYLLPLYRSKNNRSLTVLS